MLIDMAIYNRVKILIAEKEFREKRKLTYRTIAAETGLTVSTLTAYITQKATRFDGPTLETLCQYFNCQPGDILTFTDIPPGAESIPVSMDFD